MSWLGWVINVGPVQRKLLADMEDDLYLDVGGTARQADQVLGPAGARQRHRRRRRDRRTPRRR